MDLIPVKTPLAVAELSARQRQLSQRHRTVLLLVDGARSEEEIRQLALQAGCAAACFDDLMRMGMLTYAEPSTPGNEPGQEPDSSQSLLPASLTLQPSVHDSFLSEMPAQAANDTTQAGTPGEDEALEEARAILIRAVRAEAPVAGALTLMRLRRATSRTELESLLEEVELRITKPFKGLWATQTILRVKEILMHHPSKKA